MAQHAGQERPSWASPHGPMEGRLWEHRCNTCNEAFKHLGSCDSTCEIFAKSHEAHDARHGPLKG